MYNKYKTQHLNHNSNLFVDGAENTFPLVELNPGTKYMVEIFGRTEDQDYFNVAPYDFKFVTSMLFELNI